MAIQLKHLKNPHPQKYSYDFLKEMHVIENLKKWRHTSNVYTCILSTGFLHYSIGNAEIYLAN